MIELDKIYNEDCLEGMKRIPSGSIDAVICDLPYGVLNKQSEGGSWDSIIPLEPLWEQYRRITKPSAAILLFGQFFVFYGQLPTYNPQMEDLNGREPNHPMGHGDHNEKNSCYGKVGRRLAYNYNDKKHPGSIIRIKGVLCNEVRFHPTQKPVGLLRYLVRTYSNEGDTILDNCIGSGTTAIACIMEKRHFIGFESNKEYFDKANSRIQNELSNLTLF